MPSFQNELRLNDSEIALALAREERRQQDGVELIPSENYCPCRKFDPVAG